LKLKHEKVKLFLCFHFEQLSSTSIGFEKDWDNCEPSNIVNARSGELIRSSGLLEIFVLHFYGLNDFNWLQLLWLI
jgi:hypothetical protein